MVHSRIREIRKQKGLTLQDVADRAGTTAQTIGRLETGTRTLSLKWVNRISKALEVEGATLLALPEQGDIEIFGEISSNGQISKKNCGIVSARLFAVEPTAIVIKKNLGPYMAGDILIFEKKSHNQKNFLGKECLVQHKNGTFYFALVLGGNNNKNFSLAPVGHKAGILENQDIVDASPIVALVRKFD